MNYPITTSPFFSYKVFAASLKTLNLLNANRQILISTINPHSFYVAEHDRLFKEALRKSEILLPDGVGIVFANRIINGTSIKRIPGMDVFLYLLRKLESASDPKIKRVFFLGSTNETLHIIQEKIKNEFPSLDVGFYSPPFASNFEKQEINKMLEAINGFHPYVLFVGMTAPKQEKWSFENRDSLNVQILCCIGAVFDFYSGRVKRPKKIWQLLGLEWFRRFLGEPSRLYKRNLISMPYFIFAVLKEAYRKRLNDRKIRR